MSCNNFGNLWNALYWIPNPFLLFHILVWFLFCFVFLFCLSPYPNWCKISLGKPQNYTLRQKHKMQDKTEISESYPQGSCSEDWVCAGRGQPSWLPLRIPTSPEGGCVPVCYRGKYSRHGELSHFLRVTGCTSRSGWAGNGLLVYRPQSIHEINVRSSVCPTMLQSTESSVRIIKWKEVELLLQTASKAPGWGQNEGLEKTLFLKFIGKNPFLTSLW